MYDELYDAWRFEAEKGELCSLPSGFYTRLVEYLRQIRDTCMSMKQKSVRTTLLEHEKTNALRMADEIVSIRYRKLLKMVISGKHVPLEFLTAEEQSLYRGVAPSAEAFNAFAGSLLEGQLAKIAVEASPQTIEPQIVQKRVTLRFLKPVPPIIGVDMKSYGPFLVEDVASLPLENAKILIKQDLAKRVEF